jgi:uncharacterized protein YdhG (YjbR/CyaY superfamily)
MAAKVRTKAKTIDGYLAALPDRPRAALEKLRKTIRAAAPKAEECISYQLAAFRDGGKMLVALGATASHCALYLMSGTTVGAFKEELAGYDTSKGTIRFPADRPPPAALVRKLVKARLAENESGPGKPRKKPSAAATRRVAKGDRGGSPADPGVVEFLGKLDHPLKPAIEALRRTILGVSPEIREGIKWNSPSFRTTEYFATLNLRGKDGNDRVWLLLHTGAKPRPGAKKGPAIADPTGLLEWLAKDRCLVTFADAKDVQAKRAALQGVIREWIRQL